MGIRRELLEWAAPRLASRTAVDVRLGVSYAAALLDDGGVGVAAVLEGSGPDCAALPEAGGLEGPAASLAANLESDSPLRSSLGLAVANAVAQAQAGEPGDILDALAPGPDDRIAMIGYFGPIAEKLRDYNLTIFELDTGRGPGCRPAELAAGFLPGMDLVIITATALVNDTMDALLACCTGAREVAVLGPSTPLVPEVWRGKGPTLLGGIAPVDAQGLLRVVSQGGGARLIHKYARKTVIRLR